MATSSRTPVTADVSVADLVAEIESVLRSHPGLDASLEAREIIASLMSVTRASLGHRSASPAEAAVVMRARVAARRRVDGAPLPYATGVASFRYLELEIDDRVLIPRPETEGLVDLVLAESSAKPGGLVIDIGTGSGAIALSLASEARFDRVVATDISVDAIAVARRNAEGLAPRDRAKLEFRSGAGLAAVNDVRRAARALVSNPPYISLKEAIDLPADVRDWEPPVALFSGDSGLDLIREIVSGAPDVLEPAGLLAVEIDSRRSGAVAEMLDADGRYTGIRVHADLFGRNRYATARVGGAV